MTEPVAAALYDEIGPYAFAAVATWLRDVAADHALETTGNDAKVISPSVSWLAECVTMYDPAHD